MTFGERLTELRNERKLSQKYVSDSIEVAQPTYALYEADKREPGFETLKKIALFFDVTTDYLLGLDDVRTHDETILQALLADNDNCLREFSKLLHDVYNMIGDVLNANQT